MAVAYAKLYEIIHRKVKDEKEAEELYNAIIEIVKEGKIEVKTEVKEELKDELATKKDIDLVREEMKAMKEEILRYVDNKINQLDKKIDKTFYLILFFIILYVVTNPNAVGFIKLLLGLK